MADLFHAIPGYQRYIFDAGREPLFFLLLAFLLTFVATRAYTRVGRARGWRSGAIAGAHLHHLVPGVLACLFAGTAIIAFRPGDDSMLLLSGLFGVGAALILDEFALILHLDDVYWTAEGRSSIEATLMGFSFGALCLLAAAPVGSDPGNKGPRPLYQYSDLLEEGYAASRHHLWCHLRRRSRYSGARRCRPGPADDGLGGPFRTAALAGGGGPKSARA